MTSQQSPVINSANSDSEEEPALLHEPEIYPSHYKIVDLPIWTIPEAQESVVVSFPVRLYRFKTNQWKERAVGQLRILKHNETGKCRLHCRADVILKTRLNHVLRKTGAYCRLSEHKCFQNSWTWLCRDSSDFVLEDSLFCAIFNSPEQASNFKAKFEEGCTLNQETIGQEADSSGANNDEETIVLLKQQEGASEMDVDT